MVTSDLNTKLLVKNYTSVQDSETGKVSSTLTASWSKWAKVEQNSGNRVLDNAAITYREAFTITMRYELTRPTLTKYKIEYRGKDMIIHSVVREIEGAGWYERLTAFSTID